MQLSPETVGCTVSKDTGDDYTMTGDDFSEIVMRNDDYLVALWD